MFLISLASAANLEILSPLSKPWAITKRAKKQRHVLLLSCCWVRIFALPKRHAAMSEARAEYDLVVNERLQDGQRHSGLIKLRRRFTSVVTCFAKIRPKRPKFRNVARSNVLRCGQELEKPPSDLRCAAQPHVDFSRLQRSCRAANPSCQEELTWYKSTSCEVEAGRVADGTVQDAANG
jgi:hypothetical protein